MVSCYSYPIGRPPTTVFYRLLVYGVPFLPTRRYASAGNRDRNVSVCLSVRLPVRHAPVLCFCVKTKKTSVMISSPSGSPMILVF